MKIKLISLILAVLFISATAHAQLQTGNLYGTVTDNNDSATDRGNHNVYDLFGDR